MLLLLTPASATKLFRPGWGYPADLGKLMVPPSIGFTTLTEIKLGNRL